MADRDHREKDKAHRAKSKAPHEPKAERTLSEDEKVDEASRESMDASDPPSHTPTHTGRPRQHEKKRDGEER